VQRGGDGERCRPDYIGHAPVAVVGQSRFQVVHPLQLSGNLLALPLHHRFQFADLFHWHHAPIFRLLRKPC
jgi:hypothetical protein